MSDAEIAARLGHNLQEIHRDIANACDRAGRSRDAVRLVAVTKYAEWKWVQLLSRLHQTFGENRPQQLLERQRQLPSAEWHLVGQLQRNKVRLVLGHAALIHSIDSLRLLERIAAVAPELPSRPQLLLQVNVSGEASKSGFPPDELKREWASICRFPPVVDIRGLMTMAPDTEDPEEARPWFRSLNTLRNELIEFPAARAGNLQLSELSMGMSGDFVPAVEEGATLVRIGSRIFEGLLTGS